MKVGIEIGTIYEDTDSVTEKFPDMFRGGFTYEAKQKLNQTYGMSVGINNRYKIIMDKVYYKKDKLPDYTQRVYDECKELNEKITKLSIYLASKTEPESEFSKMEMREEWLMRRQLNYMKQYQEMLLQRLDMYV